MPSMLCMQDNQMLCHMLCNQTKMSCDNDGDVHWLLSKLAHGTRIFYQREGRFKGSAFETA